MNIPENRTGVVAFGVKTGIITFDDNIVDVVEKSLKGSKDLIKDKDIICVTEAVVAITQHNYVKLSEVKKEIKQKLKLKENSTIGILFPIISRNRFSMILHAISQCVPKGKVIVQLLFPSDEQGNQIMDLDFIKKLKKKHEDKITLKEIGKNRFLHPFTGVDYIQFYQDIIEQTGAKAEIYLSNNTDHMVKSKPNAIIVSNVQNRETTFKKVKKSFKNTITLQHICSNPKHKAYCEFGLLGSNILDPKNETLKLGPNQGDQVCESIKRRIKKVFNKNVEVLIYGDGAYKDPETGIYELADPVSAFGTTKAISCNDRVGVKSKYLMQKLYNEGKSKKEIEQIIGQERSRVLKQKKKNDFASEGTTPRKIKNLAASLADLVSGSADSNTPVVIVRGYLE